MKSIRLSFALCCALLFFLLAFLCPPNSTAKEVDLTFKDMTLSANLKAVPLKFIVEKIGKEKGIWFKGDKALQP